MSVPHVVLLGGGFVSIGAMRSLRRSVRRGEVRVSLVDRENYKMYHGVAAELVVGRMAPTHVLNPVRRMFPDADLYMAEVEEIDLDGRRVLLRRQRDGVEHALGYDHLVLGLGSVDNLAMYPGLGEHAFKLKTYDDCFRLRTHIIAVFEHAEIETDPDERRRLLTFFVAGGGYAGTEVATEIAELATRLCGREYPRVRRDEVRVVVVHPGPSILPELDGEGSHARFRRLVEYATAHAQGLGVELKTSTRVTAASPNEVVLSDGERVPTRTIISAVGTLGNPVIARLDVPLDRRGRVEVDDHLRVPGHSGVWAGGDCAAVPAKDGGTCPPQALYALQAGVTIGKNLLAQEQARPLTRFRFSAFGQGVALSGRRAVGEVYGVGLKGRLPWAVQKALLVKYTPTWDRKLRLVTDWAVTGLVGRDVVESSVADADDFELSENVFSEGEVIVREGRAGRLVHVVVEGTVDLVRTGDDGSSTVLATLGAGETFGQAWRDATALESAVARTRVRTVSMRVDQTRRLQQLLQSMAKTVAADVPAPRRAEVDAVPSVGPVPAAGTEEAR